MPADLRISDSIQRISAAQITPANVALLWDAGAFVMPHSSASSQSVRSVEINPIDACNHACDWCFTREHRSTHVLPTALLRRYLDSFISGGGRSIHLSGGGEPLLYWPLFEPQAAFDGKSVLEFCLDRQLVLGLITNGLLLGKVHGHLQSRIRHLGFVRVSLDATTPDLYRHAHKTKSSDFHRVISALQDLLEMRGTSPTPAIGISFIVDPVRQINASPGAIEDIARLSATLGVDFAQIKHVHTSDAVSAENFMKKVHLWCLASSAWGQTEFWIHHYDISMPNLACHVPRLSQVLGASGDRYPCCHRFGDKSFYDDTPFDSLGKSAVECLAPICRHKSVNDAVIQSMGNHADRRALLEELQASIKRDGFHPYRLFPSAPNLFAPFRK